MPFEETVEAQGHLIDSHVMEQIFDKVVESEGRFEVEQFRIGRTNGDPSYLRLRDLKAGDLVVTGMTGIRVTPESKERDRLAFAFMANEISSERQVETAVRQTANLMRQTRAAGLKIIAV